MRMRTLVVILAGVCFFAPAAALRHAAWPMLGHDAQHTGATSAKGPVHGARAWAFQMGSPLSESGNCISSASIDAQDNIYYGSADGYLYKLSASGALLWRAGGLGGYLCFSTPAISADGALVYLGTQGGTLYALNGTSGASVWTHQTGSWICASPSIGSDGTVFAGGSDHVLRALDGRLGTLLWSFQTGIDIFSSASLMQGMLYIGVHDDSVGLLALNASTGVEAWRVPGRTSYTPAAANGLVYAAFVGPGAVSAFNATTGSQVWTYSVGALAPPPLNNGVPVLGHANDVLFSFGGTIFCLHAGNGGVRWMFNSTSPEGACSISTARNLYYATCNDGYLYALTAQGQAVWSYSFGTPPFQYSVTSSPAINSRGVLVIASGVAGGANSSLLAIS